MLARPVSRTGDVAEGPQFDAALVAGGFVGDVLQGLVVLPAGELFDEEHGGVVEPVFGVVRGVGGDENVVQVPERAVGGEGFDFEDVKGCAADAFGAESFGHGGFIDDRATSHVHDDGRFLHAVEFGGAHHVLRGGSERCGDDDVIALRQHGVEFRVGVDFVDIFIAGAGSCVPAKGENVHAEGFGAAGDGPADIAVADDAHGLGGEFEDIEDFPAVFGLGAQHAGEILGPVESSGNDEFAQGLAEGAAAIGERHVACLEFGGHDAIETGVTGVDPFEFGGAGQNIDDFRARTGPIEENPGFGEGVAEAVGGFGNAQVDVRAE